MFDIGWSEFLIVIVVLLLVVGPKDLPRIVRSVGQWTGKARSYARDFQRTIEEAAEETEMSAIRKEIELANKEIASVQKATVNVDGAVKLDEDDTSGQSSAGAGSATVNAAASGEAAKPAAAPDPATSSVAQAVQAGESAAASTPASDSGTEANAAKSG